MLALLLCLIATAAALPTPPIKALSPIDLELPERVPIAIIPESSLRVNPPADAIELPDDGHIIELTSEKPMVPIEEIKPAILTEDKLKPEDIEEPIIEEAKPEDIKPIPEDKPSKPESNVVLKPVVIKLDEDQFPIISNGFPWFTLPKFPNILNIPKPSLPSLPSLSLPSLPSFSFPSFSLPKLPLISSIFNRPKSEEMKPLKSKTYVYVDRYYDYPY